jgi:hypothetical protein
MNNKKYEVIKHGGFSTPPSHCFWILPGIEPAPNPVV